MSGTFKQSVHRVAAMAYRGLTHAQFTALSMMKRAQVGSGKWGMVEYGVAEIEAILARTDRTVRGRIAIELDPALQALPPGGMILDVGSSARCCHPRSLSIDCQEGADLVFDIMKGLPFPSRTFDLAVCTAVLEHVPEPEFLVSEMKRVLKKGGRIHAAIPFLQPFHAAPNDYQRYTETGIRYLFRDFREEEVRWSSRFGETLAWIIREWRTVAADYCDRGVLHEVFHQRWDELDKALMALDHNQQLHADGRRGLYVAGGIQFQGIKE